MIVLPQNGAPTREAKTPKQNRQTQDWRTKAQAAIERSRQQTPQSLSYAPELESRASVTWNVIRRDGLY